MARQGGGKFFKALWHHLVLPLHDGQECLTRILKIISASILIPSGAAGSAVPRILWVEGARKRPLAADNGRMEGLRSAVLAARGARRPKGHRPATLSQ